jgi:hypothetical protein
VIVDVGRDGASEVDKVSTGRMVGCVFIAGEHAVMPRRRIVIA